MNSHLGLLHGMTFGLLTTVMLFMFMFSMHSLVEKKPNATSIFLYGGCATFFFILSDIYIVHYFHNYFMKEVPLWLLAIGKVSIPIGAYFNYRAFVKSLPINSLETYKSWYKAKKTFLLFDTVIVGSVFLMTFFVQNPTVVIVIAMAVIIFEKILSIFIAKSALLYDSLKAFYNVLLIGISLVATVAISLLMIYRLEGLSEKTFIYLHVFFVISVIIYSFALIHQNFKGSSLKEDTSKLNADGFFKHIYHALNKEEEFFLMYQPKIRLDTRKVCGVEALIRWNHKSKGLISPAEFIPMAEKTSIINNICEWLITQTIKDIKKFNERGINVPVSINFSVINITPVMIRFLIKELKDNYLPSSCIIIEITESVFLDMSAEQLLAINELNNAGIKLSLDDFGAGYSSVRHLDKLPLSEVKIDRALIESMTDLKQKAVVRTLIDMCHIFDISVVAEGVNEEAILQDLLSMNCEMGQGYGICYPQTTDDVMTWIFENLSHQTIVELD